MIIMVVATGIRSMNRSSHWKRTRSRKRRMKGTIGGNSRF